MGSLKQLCKQVKCKRLEGASWDARRVRKGQGYGVEGGVEGKGERVHSNGLKGVRSRST